MKLSEAHKDLKYPPLKFPMIKVHKEDIIEKTRRVFNDHCAPLFSCEIPNTSIRFEVKKDRYTKKQEYYISFYILSCHSAGKSFGKLCRSCAKLTHTAPRESENVIKHSFKLNIVK